MVITSRKYIFLQNPWFGRKDQGGLVNASKKQTLQGKFCRSPRYIMFWKVMAGVTGLEPAASGVTGRRSNQLSYTPLKKGLLMCGCSMVFPSDNPKNAFHRARIQKN